MKETKIIKVNTIKHNFFNINKKINFFIIFYYDYNYKILKFKVLVIKFKDYYKLNSFK